MASSTALWRTDRSNHWGLYTNSDYKLPPVVVDPAKDPKSKLKGKIPADCPFYFNKSKQETKGTITCTPKGYGIIQSIDQDKSIITVKVQGVVHEFDRSEVLSEIPITIVFMKGSTKVQEIIYLSVTSTLKEMFDKVQNSLDSGDSLIEAKLYSQGKELEKTDETLEKLKIAPFSKILATYTPGKPLRVSRYATNCAGWCIGSSGLDGISFSASKNIRVIGFGIYPPTGNSEMTGTAKLHQGDGTKGTLLWSEDIKVAKNATESDSTAYRINFDKPYLLKQGDFFACTISFTGSGNSYYGNNGKVTTEGEGDVTFTFKNCEGAHNGTNSGSGQIPEIYYYA